jgi:YesN/AraC family two-component response regulator
MHNYKFVKSIAKGPFNINVMKSYNNSFRARGMFFSARNTKIYKIQANLGRSDFPYFTIMFRKKTSINSDCFTKVK